MRLIFVSRDGHTRQALSELENWPPLRAAERAITENIDYLEKKMTDLPQPPTAVAVSDPRMLGAVLTAPAALSGLSDAEWNVVRERARTALHPQQAQMQQQLAKSLDDLRGGIEAAKRMVRERCQIGEDDSIRKPLLSRAKLEAA